MYEPKEYKIESIKVQAEDIKLFRVKTNIAPMPGQFFQLSILGKGECPLASCSFNNEYVELLVKKVGNVTSALFELKAGDKVFLRGPYGNGFNLKELEKSNLILIAGGTGIAPVTSLIEHIEKNRRDFSNITIFFGFRDEEHILLKERLEKWKKDFKTIISLDKGNNKNYEIGFVNDILEKHKIGLKDTRAVLCGPEIMMLNATKKLNELGLKNDRIYWSMERRMECGIRSCGRCLIEDLYVCRDGPVFRYNDIKEKLENEAK